jgi:hypothetical protein
MLSTNGQRTGNSDYSYWSEKDRYRSESRLDRGAARNTRQRSQTGRADKNDQGHTSHQGGGPQAEKCKASGSPFASDFPFPRFSSWPSVEPLGKTGRSSVHYSGSQDYGFSNPLLLKSRCLVTETITPIWRTDPAMKVREPMLKPNE